MLTRRTHDRETMELTRGRKRALMLVPAGIVLGALFVLAAPEPANAKNEFEDGFKSELGRIAAHQAAGLGRGILGQVIHGGHGVERVDHRRGGRGQRRDRHDDGRGDRYYQPYPQYRPWWSFRHHRHHRNHIRQGHRPYGYGFGFYNPGHGHRGHRHGPACGRH